VQIGESISLASIPDPEGCWLAHEVLPNDIDNALVGKGGKLKSKMLKGSPTFRAKSIPGFEKEAGIDDPRTNEEVEIDLRGANEPSNLQTYKISYAAHHLIPAQESLSRAQDLLQYLLKKGTTREPSDIKGLPKLVAKPGLAWGDVGYDTNGSQNGIFLPTSRAVWIEGEGMWTLSHEEDDDPGAATQDSKPDEAKLDPRRVLSGRVSVVPGVSRKWVYVEAVVNHASASSQRGHGAQFHDRHLAYSNLVTSLLNGFAIKIATLLHSNAGGACPDCKKARKSAPEGTPPPYGVIARMNSLSARLEASLDGKIWRPNVYTSEWGHAHYHLLLTKKQAAIVAACRQEGP
jgi:hypothetical protein